MESFSTQCHLCSSNNLVVKHRLGRYEIRQCLNCGLLSQSPLPSLDELYEIYNDPEYWKHPYFRKCRANYECDNTIRMYEWALARLEGLQPRKGKLLDVGCGTGVFLDIARRTGWNVCGIECSTFETEYARREFGLNVQQGMIERIPVPVGEFQVITLWDIIEHLRLPEQVIAKLSQALAPNGIMLIFTPNARSLVRDISSLLDIVIPPKPKPFVEMIYSPLHIHYFNRETLRTLLGRHSIAMIGTHQFPMSPERAVHGTPFRRGVLRFFDAIGGIMKRKYRFIAFGQKKIGKQVS